MLRRRESECSRWLGPGLAVALLASSGCAGVQPSSRDLQVLETANRAEVLQAQRTVMDLRAEVQRLQQELGTARAAQARLEGELRETQRRLLEAQHVMDGQEEELARAREERGRAAEAMREQTRIQQLEAAVEKQTQEIAEIKSALQKAATLAQAKPAGAESAAPLPKITADPIIPVSLSSGSPPRTVTVQRGDTLWDLARKHRVKLSELKARNNLAADLITPGQQLVLPE